MGVGKTCKGYLDLCRISNLPSVWTNVLCAVVIATGRFSWDDYLLPVLSLSCLYLAGMCLNDICDMAYDEVHRPSRPIPSGRVPVSGAWLLALFLVAAGSLLLLGTPFREGLYGAFLLVVLIIWYDFHHKQNPFSVLLMASCRFMVFAVSSLATMGSMPSAILVAGGIQFTYVVCVSLVARHENSRKTPFSRPVIPLMLAGISLLDGLILAVFIHPAWLVAGLVGAVLMIAGQQYVRGD